ncbi:MAG: hypothetical protein ACC628_21530 [Pirellulaceae bacterium]
MTEPIRLLGVFLHLARASELRRRPHVSDRLFLLAAVIASDAGLERIAAYCRHRILEHNPHHAVRRWSTIKEAVDDQEFVHFLRHLQRRFPPEKAERMLETLSIEMGRERDTYYSDEEYAASLLGITPESLDNLFGDSVD